MHSKSLLHGCLIGLAFSMASCGALGNKKPIDDLPTSLGDGCLNDSKDLLQRYSRGQITNQEWSDAFDCIGESLKLFTGFVRGSTTDTYSQSDMFTFVSRFLITRNTVTPDLLTGLFELKTALLGGSPDAFTITEIDRFTVLLPQIRDISAELIPYLAAQNATSDSYETHLASAEAFSRAGDRLADLLNSLPVGNLSAESVNSLVNQLTRSLDLPIIDGLSAKVFLAKWLFFNTRPDTLEKQEWAEIVKAGMNLGGLAVAVFKAPTSNPIDDFRYLQFLWEVAQRAKPFLLTAIQSHGGVVPFPLLDRVIDELPARFLEKLGISKQNIKQALRPVFRKILRSPSRIGLDAGALNLAYEQLGQWVANTALIDRFYEQMGLNPTGVPTATLLNAMTQFSQSLDAPSQVRFLKIRNTILTYAPQFHENKSIIRFQNGNQYCKLQLIFTVSIEQLAWHLHRSYGSGNGFFQETDFVALYNDFIDLLFALKIFDPTSDNFPGKRFQDMDLFTLASDGNQRVSIPELVNYAMIVTSAGNLTNRMRATIGERCDQNLGVDILGWRWISSSCFRNEFNQKFDQWLENFPILRAYWAQADAATRNRMMIWMEHGARRNGFNDDSFASFDFKAIPTLLHYAESMFRRFEGGDGMVLTKSEILDAFPVFENVIKGKVPFNIDRPGILKAFFTYIVRYREMPTIDSGGAFARLLWWTTIWSLPTTRLSTDRAGLFNVICQLAAPESKAQAELTPVICKP